MTEAWIGVIGTLIGTVVGGLIAAFISLREQQREPRILVLEKRIAAYGKLFRRLYEVADCLHQNDRENMATKIYNYRETVLEEVFYLDSDSKEKILAVYNYLNSTLDKGELEPHKLEKLINDANRQLFKGIDIKYT